MPVEASAELVDARRDVGAAFESPSPVDNNCYQLVVSRPAVELFSPPSSARSVAPGPPKRLKSSRGQDDSETKRVEDAFVNASALFEETMSKISQSQAGASVLSPTSAGGPMPDLARVGVLPATPLQRSNPASASTTLMSLTGRLASWTPRDIKAWLCSTSTDCPGWKDGPAARFVKIYSTGRAFAYLVQIMLKGMRDDSDVPQLDMLPDLLTGTRDGDSTRPKFSHACLCSLVWAMSRKKFCIDGDRDVADE